MTIHIGKKIEEEVYRQRIPITEFTKNIGKRRNSAYKIFEKHYLDTSVLHMISRALKCNFFTVLSKQEDYEKDKTDQSQVQEPGAEYLKNTEELIRLMQQKEALEKENAYLKTLVDQLVSRIGPLEDPKG